MFTFLKNWLGSIKAKIAFKKKQKKLANKDPYIYK